MTDKYSVIRDSQEKVNFWDFRKSGRCLGTIVQKLATADYTLQGYEDVLLIERKANTGEFAANIVQSRFDRELERLSLVPHAYVVLEFTLADVESFPVNSGIPPEIWPSLRITPEYMFRRLTEMMVWFPSIKFIPAGGSAKELCNALFKRIVDKCPLKTV